MQKMAVNTNAVATYRFNKVANQDRETTKYSADTGKICFQIRNKEYNPLDGDDMPGVVVFDPNTHTMWIGGVQYPQTEKLGAVVEETSNPELLSESHPVLKLMYDATDSYVKRVYSYEKISTDAVINTFGITDITKTSDGIEINGTPVTDDLDIYSDMVTLRGRAELDSNLGVAEIFDPVVTAKVLCYYGGVDYDTELTDAYNTYTLSYDAGNWVLYDSQAGDYVADFPGTLECLGIRWLAENDPTTGTTINIGVSGVSSSDDLYFYNKSDDSTAFIGSIADTANNYNTALIYVYSMHYSVEDNTWTIDIIDTEQSYISTDDINHDFGTDIQTLQEAEDIDIRYINAESNNVPPVPLDGGDGTKFLADDLTWKSVEGAEDFIGVHSEGSGVVVTPTGDLADYITVTNVEEFNRRFPSGMVLFNSTSSNQNSIFALFNINDRNNDVISQFGWNTSHIYRHNISYSYIINAYDIAQNSKNSAYGTVLINKRTFIDWMNTLSLSSSTFVYPTDSASSFSTNYYIGFDGSEYTLYDANHNTLASNINLDDTGITFNEEALVDSSFDLTSSFEIELYYYKGGYEGYVEVPTSNISIHEYEDWNTYSTSTTITPEQFATLDVDWENVYNCYFVYDNEQSKWLIYEVQNNVLGYLCSSSSNPCSTSTQELILNNLFGGLSIDLDQYYTDNSITQLPDITNLPIPILNVTSESSEPVIVPGTHGLVPAPQIEDINKYLCSDGTWKEVEVEIDDFNSNSGGGGSASIEFDGNLAPYATVTDITKYQQNGIYNIPNTEKTYLEYIENPAVKIYYKTKISGLFDNYITRWQTTYPSADNAIVTNIVKNYLYGYSSEYTLVGESSPNNESSFGHIYSTNESATISALISANIISDMGTYSSNTVYFTYDYMNVCWNISTMIGGTILSTTFDLSDYSISSDLDMSEYTTYYFSFTVVLNDVSSNVDLYQGNTWVANDASPLTIDYTDNILNGELDLDNDVITIPLDYDQFNDLEAVKNMLGIQLSNIDPSITEGELEIEYTSTSSYHNGLVPAPENNSQVLISTGWKNVWTGTETEYNNVNWDSSNPMLDVDTGIEYYTIYVTED